MDLTPEQYKLISNTLSVILTVAALGLPLTFLIRTRRLGAAILWMWFALVIWSVIMCLIAPMGLLALTNDRDVFSYFPEMPAIVGMVGIGWLPAAVYCFVVHLIHLLILELKARWRKRSAT